MRIMKKEYEDAKLAQLPTIIEIQGKTAIIMLRNKILI